MKKSVNGLGFDAIFAEKGKEVKFEDLDLKKTYYSSSGIKSRAAIFCTKRVTEKCHMVVDSGYYSEYAIFCKFIFNECKIFEATPNQIDLLNAYKTESK